MWKGKWQIQGLKECQCSGVKNIKGHKPWWAPSVGSEQTEQGLVSHSKGFCFLFFPPKAIVRHGRDFKQGHVQWSHLCIWKITLVTEDCRAVKVDAEKIIGCGTSSSGERWWPGEETEKRRWNWECLRDRNEGLSNRLDHWLDED